MRKLLTLFLLQAFVCSSVLWNLWDNRKYRFFL